MTSYERYAELRDAKGVKDATVARETGVSKSTFSDWKSGRSAPKTDKLQKIADYLGVSLEDIATKDKITLRVPRLHEDISEKIKEKVNEAVEKVFDENMTPYYIDQQARELAEFLRSNPEYAVLFDAAQRVKPEDLEFVRQFIDKMTK